MRKNKLKKFTRRVVIAANVAAILLLLLVGHADRFDPNAYPMLATLGLAMPLALLINLGFLVFWVVVSPRYAFIPLAGLLISYVPVRAYCPINLPEDPPPGSLKLMSFNVQRLDSVDRDASGRVVSRRAIDYIVKSQADIVCMQELWPGQEKDPTLLKAYPYVAGVRRKPSGQVLVVASRFPIVHKQLIRFDDDGDGAGAFWIDIGGDTIIVVNNHLLSNGLALSERQQVDSLLKGQNNMDKARSNSKNLLHKLVEATQLRAPQADSVAYFVRHHRKRSIIVCGDFNSSPNAYPRRRLTRDLTDCFEASGNGVSWTYNQNHIYVRIDHILCSPDWQPYACQVDNEISASDHYPIVCWLKKKEK